MSDILLTDKSLVPLLCRFQEDGAFDVHYDGKSLADYDVVVELENVAATGIAVGDFTYAGKTHRASAYTVEVDGTLSAWDRDVEGVRSPALSASMGELVLHAAIVAVRYDDSLPPDQQAVYVPTSGYAQVRIRVRKKGSMPFV